MWLHVVDLPRTKFFTLVVFHPEHSEIRQTKRCSGKIIQILFLNARSLGPFPTHKADVKPKTVMTPAFCFAVPILFFSFCFRHSEDRFYL